MDTVLDRIDSWQAAGLIDMETATRLRDAERPEVGPEPASAAVATRLSGFFGPTPTIAEAFAYIGGGFLIAAYTTFLGRLAGSSLDRELILSGGFGVGTIVLIVLGLWLARRGARARRGAGVLFLIALEAAVGTAAVLVQAIGWTWGAPTQLLIAGWATAVAVGLRVALPAITTQVGLLAALTFLGGMVIDVVKGALDGTLGGLEDGGTGAITSVPPIANVWNDVLLPVVGWMVISVAIGLVGLRESRRRAAGTDGRAALSRFWAGMVLIAGTWAAVHAFGYRGDDAYGRILEPWLGDLIIVAIVVVLVERAFRRDAVAFIVPAALGLIAALSDLNFTYLAGSTEVGLLLEGVVLLGVGFGADRLRRRLDRGDGATPARPAAPEPVATAAS